jgi:hypothetical protein
VVDFNFSENVASKYKAKRTPYNGRMYHSAREAHYAAELDILMNARGPERVREWTPQVRVPLKVRSDTPPHREVLICHYVIDFAVTYMDSHVEYHEVKGCWTDVARLKVKLFEALYPDMKLVVVK